MNKKNASVINNWKRSMDTDLYDVYKSPSSRKYRAFKYCQELCRQYNGTELKIISHNCQMFTVGFQFVNPDTGVVQLMHIIPSYNRVYDMI